MTAKCPRVLIVGAGPAGLSAAVAAAESGARVTVLEKQKRPGLKLLASGGGRCNITNILSINDFAAAFGRQGRFTLNALQEFTPDDLRAFFAQNDVPTEVTDGFHVFPKSGSARDILSVMLNICKRLRVNIKTSCKAERLLIEDEKITGLETSEGTFPADKIIIAGGGKGYPKLGGSTLAYQLSEQAGHRIVQPLPGMVGLRSFEDWPGRCAGISFDRVNSYIDLPKFRKVIHSGELLFTHHGVSGPSIIDLAGEVSKLLTKKHEVPLIIKLFPDKEMQYWQNFFKQHQGKSGKKQLLSILSQVLPKALANGFCTLANVDGSQKLAELKGDSRDKLCELLYATPLTIKGTDGWDKAMLTWGGVALKKVNPDTLESRLVSGLFFAGEVLDLQGPCGGYNLQWAFSSGKLAGKSVLK